MSSIKNGETTNYQYDYLSRRITKETNGITTEYVYDGWNPISEKAPTLTKYYTWGMDLSGSLQGAGGVGGLLSVTEISSDPNATHESVSNNAPHASVLKYYPTYDGNGNVSEYIDATSTTVAHYQYDAFGNTIDSKTTGAKANDFAHRFSTKALDSETGFYYYGYRYYDPVTGRWLSRDPIGENGLSNDYDDYERLEFVQLTNLYGFGPNDPVNGYDVGGEGWWSLIPSLFPKRPPAPKPPTPKPPKPKPKKKGCKPCAPSKGTLMYRVDKEGKSHGGIPRPHSHEFKVNQSPYPARKCFVNKTGNVLPGEHGLGLRSVTGGGKL